MTTKANSPSKESADLKSFFQTSFKSGMNVAERLQQAAVEVPLGMLESVGVDKRDTDVLRENNRQLVHGMVGTIESIASKFVQAGTEQVGAVADALKQAKSKVDS